MVRRIVNPPSMKAPSSLLVNPSERTYFQQLDYFLYQLWQRTGGGDDFIGDSVKNIIPGNDISVDDTDGENPIVSYTGGDPLAGFDEYFPSHSADEVVTVADDNYTTFTSETVIVTRYVTITLNAYPDDGEIVNVVLATDKIKIDGNGRNVYGQKAQKVYRKYTSRKLIYILSEDEWFAI